MRLTRIQELIRITTIPRALATTTNKYQFMVSDSSGFTGPYIAIQGTLGNSDSQWIITITKDSPYTLMVILITLTFFFKQGRKIVDFMEYLRYFQDLPKPC